MTDKLKTNHEETRDYLSLERRLLNAYQHAFPLCQMPYTAVAEVEGSSEIEVLEAFAGLQDEGVISRIGAVVRPHSLGWSTLAALAVPEDRLEEVANFISAFPEVNHNYEREHDFNLWFVVTGCNEAHVAKILGEISAATGLQVLDLPLEEAFTLDLGFELRW